MRSGPQSRRSVFFPVQDPIGKRVYMPESTDFYTVVGVLEPKNASAAIGGSLSAQDYSGDYLYPD